MGEQNMEKGEGWRDKPTDVSRQRGWTRALIGGAGGSSEGGKKWNNICWFLTVYQLPCCTPSLYPGHTLVCASLLALKSAVPLLLASCPSPLPTFPSLPTTKLSWNRLWMDSNPGSLLVPLGRWLPPWAWVSASVKQMATLWTRITQWCV